MEKLHIFTSVGKDINFTFATTASRYGRGIFKNMTKLSVVILTWNVFPILHDTMHMLSDELKGIDSEVIIVDNGSTDGCQEMATIKNPTNLGISKGKNQGIEASKGEYIMLLDGDIYPVPNSIRMLLEYMETHKGECDAIGFMPNKFSNVSNKTGHNTHENYCHTLFNPRPHRGHCIYYGMYRRTVFERGAMMDEGYGPGYGWEDLDQYEQMKRLGIVQWVAGMNWESGKYYHAINSSIKQMGFQEYMRSSLQRGEYYKKKWDKIDATIYVGNGNYTDIMVDRKSGMVC